MPFIPAPQVAMVEVRGLLFNQQVENTLYFQRIAAEITPAALEQLCFDVQLYWTSNMIPKQSLNYQLREVYGTDLTTATSEAYTSIAAPPVAGEDPRVSAPGGTTLAISFRTLNRGRSARGRNYFIGIPKDELSGNVINNPYVVDVVLAYNGMVGASVVSDGWVWGVLSRYTGGNPRAQGLFNSVVAAIAVDNSVDSQRRRLNGRGN